MLSQNDLLKRLNKMVGEQHVVVDGGVNASAVDGMVPRAVVFPGSVEEVAMVLAFASVEGLRVSPRGGGTKVMLGRAPDAVDVVLCLKRLNRLVDHEPADMTATFQAGITLLEAQTVLKDAGQFIALDSPFADTATLGGILAANSSGPLRYRYGSARDLLIAVRAVLVDGSIIKGGAKVVKSVSGYDMNKLFIGSLGTLGVIVEATFRLYPIPRVEKTQLIPCASADDASMLVAGVLDSTLAPSMVELFCPVAANRVVQQTGHSWPDGQFGLAVAFGSVSSDAVDAQLQQLKRDVHRRQVQEGTTLDEERHCSFWASARGFAMGDQRRVVLKASVLLTKVGEAVKLGQTIASRMGLDLAMVSEAGSGIVRYQFVQRAGEEESYRQGISEAVVQLRDFAQAGGGSLVVLEAPPEMKSALDVWGPVGTALPLMKRLKDQFDPKRILNPGRFVGGI
ncbi:MAG: FAD-binding protein [Deltaproteobacteria bacterium]|nr:FAD-binding protein [Deltaproteobacteria bacterium]